MKRMNIVNIVNELAPSNLDDCCWMNFDLKECYDLILNYCIKSGTLHSPRKNTYQLDNGVLVINGQNIGRVQPLIKPFNVYDEVADYYENKNLARAERY